MSSGLPDLTNLVRPAGRTAPGKCLLAQKNAFRTEL